MYSSAENEDSLTLIQPGGRYTSTASVNKPANFLVKYKSKVQPVDVQWQDLQGIPIPWNVTSDKFEATLEAVFAKLTIKNVQLTDMGSYNITAKNGKTKKTVQFKLQVTGKN